MAGKAYRVRQEHRAVAVLHPLSGMHVVPDASVAYAEDDPLVRAYQWMFTTDTDASGPTVQPPVESVALDPATQTVRRGPGRPRKT